MSNHDTPTPQSRAAEVCERLKNWQWFCENTAKAFLRYEMPIEHIKELGETLTAALLLIEQGEKERERLEKALVDAQLVLAMVPHRGRDDAYMKLLGAEYITPAVKAIDAELAARAQPTPESK